MSKACCSIDGCDRPYYSRNMCSKHYNRWYKTGSTDLQVTEPGAPMKYLLGTVLNYKDKDACLIWPYGRGKDGYGQIRHKGKTKRVHRLICRKIRGKPPTKEHLSCHTCGKGDGGCVNPHHLGWGTPAQNQADRLRDGTDLYGQNNGRAKLTDKQVRKIRSYINKGYDDRTVASKFEVTFHTIRAIRLNRRWQHVT